MNIPSNTTEENTSITIGRHERCSQFPCDSERITEDCSRCKSASKRESTSVKLARNCIFSFEERVSESITSPISLTKFDNIFIFSFLKVLHSSNNFIPKNRTREKGKLYHFILNTQHHEYNHITCKK